MKNLSNYIHEKLVINKEYEEVKSDKKEIQELFDWFDFRGTEPSLKIAKAIHHLGFYCENPESDRLAQAGGYNWEERPKVIIEFDSSKKTVKFDNLAKISGTIKKFDNFFDELDYTITFPKKIKLEIRSGMSMNNRSDWPGVGYVGYRQPCGWWDIIRRINAHTPNIEIERLELNRFDGDCKFPTETLKNVYVDEIYFSECKFELDMELPDVDIRKDWKNPNLKLTSGSSRAEKYYKENGF